MQIESLSKGVVLNQQQTQVRQLALGVLTQQLAMRLRYGPNHYYQHGIQPSLNNHTIQKSSNVRWASWVLCF